MLAKEFVDYYGTGDNVEIYPWNDDSSRPDGIHEANFSKDLRFKSVNFEIANDNTISIDWLSQFWNNPREFFNEIARTFKYYAQLNNLEEVVYIKVRIHDRDREGSASKTIKINTTNNHTINN